MKTKRFVLLFVLIIFVFISIQTKALDWTAVVETRHYTISYNIPPYQKSFIKIASVKDSYNNIINCRMSIRYNTGITGVPDEYKDILYKYGSDRKVSYKQKKLDRFCSWYDVNANPVDRLTPDEFPTS